MNRDMAYGPGATYTPRAIEYKALRNLVLVLGNSEAQGLARVYLLNDLVREVQGR